MYQIQIRLIGDSHIFNIEYMVVLLVGRGQTALNMLSQYDYADFNEGIVVAIEPFKEWYPCPNGIDDQIEAIEGLKSAIPKIDKLILNLQNQFNLSRDKVSLVGFSAGAVMAIQLAVNSDDQFAKVVSHAGAILDPKNLPQAKNNTPILLIHAKDDDCFSWEERYLPMKKALEKQGFNITTKESEYGGHYMMSSEAMNFLINSFDKE